jgi:hypothetical protein
MSRVSKGKENRGIDSYALDLTSDLDRLGTPNAKNDQKTSRRLSSEQCHQNGSSRKKQSIDITNTRLIRKVRFPGAVYRNKT